ncbi:MAG TPA: OmpA family protein [Ignavibacteria bacterium]
MIKMIKYFNIVFFLLLIITSFSFGQTPKSKLYVVGDKVKLIPNEYEKNIQVFNVDISNFPEINLIMKVSPNYLSRLKNKNLKLYQDGKEQKILSIEKTTYKNKIPVDIVIVIDKTGSMIDYIDKIKLNIQNFIQNILMKGIDYKIGIVTFSDIVDSVYQFTRNIDEIEKNLASIKAIGGNDKNENALEGLNAAYNYNFRPDAKKIILIFTDALFHYKGFCGDGKTDLTLEEVIDLMKKKNINVYTVVPLMYDQYKKLSKNTGGKTYNITDNFNSLLETFSDEISQYYTVRYLYNENYISDSIEVELYDKKHDEYLVSNNVSFLDLNKMMVISNDILFDFNKSEIKPIYYKNLKNLTKFLKLRNSIEISINGHTDNIGSDEYNNKLSLDRANSVKEFLIKNGVSASRLTIYGFGKTKPIASNDTEQGRQLNRRIEIFITKK